MKISRRNNTGLTLIEVLIALAILSIALTAIIRSTSQNIVHTLYLQNRTLATWVGTPIINETRVGILTLPLAPDHLERKTELLGQSWYWQANLSNTSNKHIRKINVDVYDPLSHTSFAHLVSYLYVM